MFNDLLMRALDPFFIGLNAVMVSSVLSFGILLVIARRLKGPGIAESCRRLASRWAFLAMLGLLAAFGHFLYVNYPRSGLVAPIFWWAIGAYAALALTMWMFHATLNSMPRRANAATKG